MQPLRNYAISLLLTVALFFTSACVKGTAGLPQPPLDPRSISAGAVASLDGIVKALQLQVDAGDTKLQPELDAAKKAYASAKLVNDTIQAGTGNTADLLLQLTQDGAAIAQLLGAGSNLFQAINLAVSIFKSVAIGFGLIKPGANAAAAPLPTLQERLKSLERIKENYQKRSKP